MPKTRLGLTFHRTFPLVRQAIAEILNAASLKDEDSGKSARSLFSANTNLGSIYIESMPRYGMGSGLLEEIDQLSSFGEIAIKFDNLFDQVSTQWLMHYHLSAPTGPGPAFWHELVKTRFRTGDEFTSQEIADQIGEIFKEQEGKPLAIRSARTTATIFLGTYTRTEGLGNLDLLMEVSQGRFKVLDPDPPSNWVIAFAFLHLWNSLYPRQVTINLNDLYGEQGLTDILMIGKSRLNMVLDEMQEEGFIQLFRVAPPYQVALLRNDEVAILRKVYGE